MIILSKGCKLDNFESGNSLNFSFMNVWGLRLNFIDCESILELNPSDILPLCGTNLDDLIDSGSFSIRGYLPLIRKDSTTHMPGLAVYVKGKFPFLWNLSLENSTDSYWCFWLALLHSLSYFFFLYQSPSFLCRVFDSISSNIDEVLLINWFASFLSLETLASIIRTGKSILVELIDLVNSIIISLYNNILNIL